MVKVVNKKLNQIVCNIKLITVDNKDGNDKTVFELEVLTESALTHDRYCIGSTDGNITMYLEYKLYPYHESYIKYLEGRVKELENLL